MSLGISSLPTIMPPKIMNSGIGGRTRSKFPAKQATVEELRHDGAAVGGGARMVRVIVRMLATGDKPHLGVCLEIVDDVRSVCEKSGAQMATGRMGADQ